MRNGDWIESTQSHSRFYRMWYDRDKRRLNVLLWNFKKLKFPMRPEFWTRLCLARSKSHFLKRELGIELPTRESQRHG